MKAQPAGCNSHGFTYAYFKAPLAGLVDRWLSGMMLGQARGAMMAEVVEGEGETARQLWARGGLVNWLEVWEKVTRLFGQADRANLDRKQVVISAFLMLESAARG